MSFLLSSKSRFILSINDSNCVNGAVPLTIICLQQQGLYGQGKSGGNISFSRWSGKVRESQGKSGNSTKKSGKSWKKSGRFFWKVLISYESRSIVF